MWKISYQHLFLELAFASLLSSCFQELAKSGKQGFYEGRVAKAIIEILQSNGGVMSLEDLKNHGTEEVKPLVTNYKVCQLPTYQLCSAVRLGNDLCNHSLP